MRLIELFAGIGGFYLGLSKAGFQFESVKFSEIDKYAIKIYQRNIQNAEYIGSVTDVHGQRGEADIITFGSPCQDFSIAGKRAGMGGKRSSLVTHAIRIIDEVRPDFFIWENVKGAFSSNAGADFWAIIKAFADLGNYRLEWQLLNTAWFLPQNRERIYLVGYNPDQSRGKIFPIGKDGRMSSKRIFGILEIQTASSIKSTCFKMSRDDNYIQIQNHHPRSGDPTKGGTGKLESDDKCFAVDSIPHKVVLSEPRHKHGGDRCYTKTAPTIQSRYGTGGDNIPYVNNIRRLTPTECERLQGFPDGWTEGISDTQRYKTLGNAVSVPVVEAVGNQIKQSIIGNVSEEK